MGRKEVAVIEFGVAGGNGLIAMQEIGRQVSMMTGVNVNVFGFDMGTGLPSVTDPRDLPQLYCRGDYRMDFDKLRTKLSTETRLVIGDIKQTIDDFLLSVHAPVGFISFDMDLYTSTRDSLKLFRGEFPLTHCLPRVVCYFDDIMGLTFGDLNGERLAIREYNRDSEPQRAISPVYGLRFQLGWPHNRAEWPDMMFWAQFLDHADYCAFDCLAGEGQAHLGTPFKAL
ncbi:MAG: hypothetical protein M3Z09_11710 [Acidobacteriota bacterium]|nr:hypothetical protein [Acidobacteriota bacterium]